MVSTLMKKGAKDLLSRKVRTILTILTISLGVAGIALFAVNPLAQGTVEAEMEEQKLNNLVIRINRTEITGSALSEMADLDNVENVEARSLLFTKALFGERKDDLLIVGVNDFNDQSVDIIILDDGRYPGEGEAITEKVNSINGIYEGGKGDTITAFDPNGEKVVLGISGTGRSLAHGKTLYDFEGYAILYTTIETVENLSGSPGYNYLSFTLGSTGEQEVDETVEGIRRILENGTGITSFMELPEVREKGEWPGGQFLEMIVNIMYILTAIALLASVFLISNTMNTMVSEKKKEIAMLKALGATRLQVVGSFLVSAASLGILGSVLGSVLGIGLSYLVLKFFGSIMGFSPTRFVHPPTLVISLISGLFVVVLSSMPSLIRASRTTIREGMDEAGISSNFGKGALDRILAGLTWMPRSISMGLRNASRKKGRSATTILQVCLAVGVFLGLMSFARSLAVELESNVGNLDYDIDMISQGGEPIPANLSSVLMENDNISLVEPYLEIDVEVEGNKVYAMGYVPETKVKKYDRSLIRGKWFSGKDDDDHLQAVMGKQLASSLKVDVGDTVEIETSRGMFELEIIGIDDDFYYLGQIVYIPLPTLQSITGNEGQVNGLYINTEIDDHGTIDLTARWIEDTLLDDGYAVESTELYTRKESTVEQNSSIIKMITLVSTMIVLISFLGLTSNLTMNILDRTKEIGMLRCIGSVSMQIRSIFTSEALLLTILGWALAIPVGYLISEAISGALYLMLEWDIPTEYPPLHIAATFVMVVIGTLIISQGPVSRATRLRPGDALRYE